MQVPPRFFATSPIRRPTAGVRHERIMDQPSFGPPLPALDFPHRHRQALSNRERNPSGTFTGFWFT